MLKPLTFLFIISSLLILCLLGLHKCSVKDDADVKRQIGDAITKSMERGYMYGQIDAMHSIVRINIINDMTATFVKSPWDDCDTSSKAVQHPCSMHDTLRISTK